MLHVARHAFGLGLGCLFSLSFLSVFYHLSQLLRVRGEWHSENIVAKIMGGVGIEPGRLDSQNFYVCS